ncbi:MAG: PDZ domain-containing protein [Clostridia bacterium]|nr:PDZ domain-containing protein [Clostridia bacterium]
MKKAYLKILSSLVFLSLIISSLFFCVSCTAGSDTVISADELLANAAAEDNYKLDYVWNYLDEWRFPAFSAGKLKRVENLYKKYYYKEIPTSYEIALEVADIFVSESYNEIELTDSDKVTDAIITAYVAAIGDPYSYYRTADEYQNYTGNMSGTFVGIGITVVYTEETGVAEISGTVKDSPAEKAGILAGDVLVAVDGKMLSDIGYETAVDCIRGEKGTKVEITVLRGGEEITFSVTRAPIVDLSVDYYITEEKIGYIDIDSFKLNTDELFIEAIDYMKENGARVIVYDVRNNGGGYLETVVNMLDYIASDKMTLASFSNNYDDPYVADDGHSLSIPSVVLCNEMSASASELFTSGIRDIGAIDGFEVAIVGKKTYGKGIMQNSYRMSDKSAVTLTVAYYFPPSGVNFDGVGIMPTNEVDGAANQRTAAFELALEMRK